MSELTTRIAVNALGFAPGGGLTYLVNQARALEARDDGFAYTWFVSPRCADQVRTHTPGSDVRVPFESQPPLPVRLAWEQLELPRIVAREGFDAIYAMGSFGVRRSPVPQAVLGANPRHHAGLGVIRPWYVALRSRIERAAVRATTSAAESVVYPGRAFADAMQSVGLPAPTAVIPTGAPRDWPDAPPDIDVLSGCARCAAEPFVLGVQNWYGHKRLDWLAAAWPEVAGESGAHLVLVGDPVRASDARRLRRALAPPGVGACVHVLSGISRCAIADLYRRAEAFVSSSLLEAGPQTPLEAMSFGIPCVLSDIGPHREYAGEAAEYFRVGDASSLRAALARARDRTGGAPPLAHDWDTNAELLAAELARIVGRPAQPGARSFATSTPGPAS